MARDIRYLALDEVIEIHDRAVQEFGGSVELRDWGLLDSCVMTPQSVVAHCTYMATDQGGTPRGKSGSDSNGMKIVPSYCTIDKASLWNAIPTTPTATV